MPRFQVGVVIFLLAVIVALGAAAPFVFTNRYSPPKKWDYKVVNVFPVVEEERTGRPAFRQTTLNVNEEQIQDLGRQGWELVGVVSESETAWANFGKDEYVTGLQPNVRPQRAVLIFKRRVREGT